MTITAGISINERELLVSRADQALQQAKQSKAK